MPSTTLRTALVVGCTVLAVGILTAGAATATLADGSPSATSADPARNATVVNVTIERAPGHLPPREAVRVAERNASVSATDWLVLTVDVGAVLSNVDRETRLDARSGGTDNVTLRIEQANPSPQRTPLLIHPANLTRFVDDANGTITYVFDGRSPRMDAGREPVYEAVLSVGAANPNVTEPRTVRRTVEARIPHLALGPDTIHDHDDPREDVLPNVSGVPLPIETGFPDGKPLTLAVRSASAGDPLVDRRLTVADGWANTTLDLSGVPNGTVLALLVADGHTGRLVQTQRLTVGQLPVPELGRIYQPRPLPETGTGTVLVEVKNEGTATFRGEVDATLGSQSNRTTVTVPPGERHNASFAFTFDEATPGARDFTVETPLDSEWEEVYVGAPNLATVRFESLNSYDDPPTVWRGTEIEVMVGLHNPTLTAVNATATVTLQNETKTRSLRLSAGAWREEVVTFPTDALATGSHTVRVAVANQTDTRSFRLRADVPEPDEEATTTATGSSSASPEAGATPSMEPTTPTPSPSGNTTPNLSPSRSPGTSPIETTTTPAGSNGSGPGFGIAPMVLAVLALAAVAGLARRSGSA